ncbi:TauD/TfdA family dioxygenase [Rickettsiales endosymbiont of Peranema trichophorum]|uniref:TauD/TfdA family dioxygenase n=1 Tax=Rickettsiales endosymbiont of Peranema trichophorum TaxID=2486577 RepID=UPI001F5D52AA|nr:TauD/TfdA family dioxygenase [Rickettsiales endosymbiont of Peranema trichophorum]
MQPIYVMILAILKHLGIYPVVYEGENSGMLVRNICPLMQTKYHVSSQGGVLDFMMHVDNPDLRIRGECYEFTSAPDILSLLCIRNNDNIETNLVSLKKVIGHLKHQSIDLLMDEEYNIKRPDSFEMHSVTKKGLPLVTFDGNNYCSRFDAHRTSTDSSRHIAVLQEFDKIANSDVLHTKVNLQPGDLLIFDNQTMLHSRRKFTPKFDGSDRWLLRVFGLYQKPAQRFLLNPDTDQHHLKTL